MRAQTSVIGNSSCPNDFSDEVRAKHAIPYILEAKINRKSITNNFGRFQLSLLVEKLDNNQRTPIDLVTPLRDMVSRQICGMLFGQKMLNSSTVKITPPQN